ncbi:hypothetical protein BS47DRAFT_1344993 [Hydnum rufescens UP504]|uniref:Uncharacterized protein n=1 Tax=Hydnum rufescens UP504 TaxID=1448309 RepID=A0A9P6DVJ6_9AGAM|nr:hypothetical protein BS47DRAFT_1344993 [Hydnum rufescens UP504]
MNRLWIRGYPPPYEPNRNSTTNAPQFPQPSHKAQQVCSIEGVFGAIPTSALSSVTVNG